MDDLEQKLKEGLLQDLIEHMSSGMGDRMKPKGMSVEVAAPDKDKLAEGLDKAKDVLGSSEIPEPEDHEDEAKDGGSDEERLMQLLSESDDDEDDQKLRG